MTAKKTSALASTEHTSAHSDELTDDISQVDAIRQIASRVAAAVEARIRKESSSFDRVLANLAHAVVADLDTVQVAVTQVSDDLIQTKNVFVDDLSAITQRLEEVADGVHQTHRHQAMLDAKIFLTASALARTREGTATNGHAIAQLEMNVVDIEQGIIATADRVEDHDRRIEALEAFITRLAGALVSPEERN